MPDIAPEVMHQAPSGHSEKSKKSTNRLQKAAQFLKKHLIPDFTTKHIPSRRTLIKSGLTVAGAVGTISLIPQGIRAWEYFVAGPQEFNKLSPQERIEKIGLGDFIPFFNATTDLINSYYGKPTLSASPENIVQDDGTDPYWTLYKAGILEGYYTGEDVQFQSAVEQLRDGWGKDKHHAAQLALGKIEQMEITDEKGNPLDPAVEDAVRIIQKRFATTMPASAKMAPDKLFITKGDAGGGGYIPPGPEEPVTAGYIQLAYDPANPEGFCVEEIHERAHAEIEWQRAKDVTKRKDYADYLETEAKAIKLTLDDYFQKSWQGAQVYLEDAYYLGPLIWYYSADTQITSIPYHDDNPNNPSIEANLKNLYGIDINRIAPLTSDQKQDPSLIFNRVIWAAGHFRQQILQKQAEIQRTKKGSLTREEKAFLQDADAKDYEGEDSDIAKLLKRAVGEMDHYFRGPVQINGGGLPGVNIGPNQPDSLITKLNIEVQQKRLQAFSTLSPEELSNFTRSSQALRNHLGLDNPPLRV